MLMPLLLTPFVLQGLAMIFDEFYFHHKRGLPLWERLGHPLDTLSVFVCYAFLYFNGVSDFNLYIYIGLCAFSCLLITKDEFVHADKCDAKESWLHSILFILHPITFLSGGIIWLRGSNEGIIASLLVGLILFIIYQITYWGFFWNKIKEK